MNSVSHLFVSLLLVVGIISSHNLVSEARRNKLSTSHAFKCQQEECQLKPNHLALYSYIKRTLESNFDISGKEILPTLKAIETLKRRFSSLNEDENYDGDYLNGTQVVKKLLSNETLLEAVNIFNSEDGKSMIDFYRSTINGKDQILSCSQFRVEDIERFSRKLDSSRQLQWLFSKIHQNFVAKSAKRCLKHSCNSIDLSMSRLDSVLSKNKPSDSSYNQLFGQDETKPANNSAESLALAINRREFEQEELKLCKLFKKTNATDCSVSGRELVEINLTDSSSLDDLLQTYYELNERADREAFHRATEAQLASVKSSLLNQCRRIKSLLDYNLYAIKWYRKQGLIDDQKISSRTFWCPSLFYWLQIDRLCGELGGGAAPKAEDKTFTYEVSKLKRNL